MALEWLLLSVFVVSATALAYALYTRIGSGVSLPRWLSRSRRRRRR